jgi:hypothetical protein
VTQVVIRRANTDLAPESHRAHVASLGELALFMRSSGSVPSAQKDAVIEAARLAMAQSRNLLGEGRGREVRDLLLFKCDDPIAELIGAHLVLLSMEVDGWRDPAQSELFDTVVRNLQGALGEMHPDVAALSLRCTSEALRTTQPFETPPMFLRSWRVIAEASFDDPALVPARLWDRVRASSEIGPFFVWAADAATREAHAQQLSKWLTVTAADDEAPPDETLAPLAASATPEVFFGIAAGGTPPPEATLLGGVMPEAAPAPALPASDADPQAGDQVELEAFATSAARPPGPVPEALRDSARRQHIPASAVQAMWGRSGKR